MNKTNKSGVTKVTCVFAPKLLRLLPDEKCRMTKDVMLDRIKTAVDQFISHHS